MVVAAVTLVCAACATRPDARPSTRDGAQFTLHTSEGAISARADSRGDGGTLTGPQVQVQWDDQRLEGQAFGRAVSLTLGDAQVRGMFGPAPVRLNVTEGDQKLHVRGLFGGHLSHLRVSTSKVEGSIGRCSYDLSEFDGQYQGFRRCGGPGPAEPVWMVIPDAFAALPRPLVAASLGMLMGSG